MTPVRSCSFLNFKTLETVSGPLTFFFISGVPFFGSVSSIFENFTHVHRPVPAEARRKLWLPQKETEITKLALKEKPLHLSGSFLGVF